ncbi:hypothetical protein [Undibacterium sp. Ren11W]|uniref:hypothetical protein n=1 Tax=Undibacterium sp. Ren11W TaxID=3413045 RepID=UPI003BEF7742
MKFWANRFKEPSSWAGIAMLASAVFGVPVNTTQVVVNTVTAVCGAVAFFAPEKTSV